MHGPMNASDIFSEEGFKMWPADISAFVKKSDDDDDDDCEFKYRDLTLAKVQSIVHDFEKNEPSHISNVRSARAVLVAWLVTCDDI